MTYEAYITFDGETTVREIEAENGATALFLILENWITEIISAGGEVYKMNVYPRGALAAYPFARVELDSSCEEIIDFEIHFKE
jgi:hypothetical protein